MSMLAILIPLGLVLVIVAVVIFMWAVKDGQFEDLDSPAWRVVLDDDKRPADDHAGQPKQRS